MAVPQKIDTLSHGENVTFAQRQFQALLKKDLYLAGQIAQISLVVVKEAEIVAVADICLDPMAIFQPLIQLVEVEVPQPLARIVPDRNILPALVAVDDFPEEPYGVGAFDLPGNNPVEDVMIHRWIKFGDVHLETIPITPDIFHRLSAACMEATALDAGVGIGQEHPLPDRLDHTHKTMMDNPIRAKGQLKNFPFFRLIDHHGLIGRCPERFSYQQFSNEG